MALPPQYASGFQNIQRDAQGVRSLGTRVLDRFTGIANYVTGQQRLTLIDTTAQELRLIPWNPPLDQIRYNLSVEKYDRAIILGDENQFFWEDAIATLRNVKAVLYENRRDVWAGQVEAQYLRDVLSQTFRQTMEVISNKPIRVIKKVGVLEVSKPLLDTYGLTPGEPACFSGKTDFGPQRIAKVVVGHRTFRYNSKAPMEPLAIGVNPITLEQVLGLSEKPKVGETIDWNYTLDPGI